MSPGPAELVIMLVIVLLLFGIGRISRLGGELGQAVSSFRKAVNSNGSEKS